MWKLSVCMYVSMYVCNREHIYKNKAADLMTCPGCVGLHDMPKSCNKLKLKLLTLKLKKPSATQYLLLQKVDIAK